MLRGYNWPGNVRELKNTMQRAALLSTTARLSAGDLGLPVSAQAGTRWDNELDRETLEASLRRAGGVVARAAADLGLSRQALYRRMERVGLGRANGEERPS